MASISPSFSGLVLANYISRRGPGQQQQILHGFLTSEPCTGPRVGWLVRGCRRISDISLSRSLELEYSAGLILSPSSAWRRSSAILLSRRPWNMESAWGMETRVGPSSSSCLRDRAVRRRSGWRSTAQQIWQPDGCCAWGLPAGGAGPTSKEASTFEYLGLWEELLDLFCFRPRRFAADGWPPPPRILFPQVSDLFFVTLRKILFKLTKGPDIFTQSLVDFTGFARSAAQHACASFFVFRIIFHGFKIFILILQSFHRFFTVSSLMANPLRTFLF